MINDPQRPVYHILPPAHWLNDPNGPIFWDGAYHLFYQHNPVGHAWEQPVHWGHVRSRDLAHWEHLPIAISPGPEEFDNGGVWSGSAVAGDRELVVLYTGVQPEVQCLATSRNGVTFEKYAGNPVIAGPPPGLTVTGFRDPCVWREEDGWYLLIGSGFAGVGGTALLYHSTDLRAWDYLHPFCIGDKQETGEMWECPDFFPLGDQYVLLVSVNNATRYFIGDYVDHRFTPRTSGLTDVGGHFYAAKSFADAEGQRLLWGWIWDWEGRSDDAQRAAGWAGVMSLPRQLTVRADNTLGYVPASQLIALRGAHHRHFVPGDSLEMHVSFTLGPATVGLAVRRAPDGDEETLITYHVAQGILTIDRTHASLDPEIIGGITSAPLALAEGDVLDLRIFLDHSVIEVFANDRLCLTTRVYPTRADSQGISLLDGSGTALRTLDIWEMESIWQ